MLFRRSFASVTVVAITLCDLVTAVPHFKEPKITYVDKRQASSTSTSSIDPSATANATGSTFATDNQTSIVINPNITATPPTTLEPVVPPAVNPADLSILSLVPDSGNISNVTLAWAGTTGGNNKHRKRSELMKRDGGVLSQANFAFSFPAVPLDHSAYVSGVSCPINGSLLTGILSGPAYSFAKQQWANASDILFITAADGCGPDVNNDYFHSTTVTFHDANNTFTASGTSKKPLDVSSYMSLEWGDLGTSSLKRSIDKRDMFELHPIHKRFDVGGEIDLFNFHWGVWLENIIGTDNDAPWEDAALVAKFSKGYGIEDDAFESGEAASASGHHKRSNESSLAIREEGYEEGIEFGLKLYCVHCGFGGSAKLYGKLEVGIHPLCLFEDCHILSLDTVQAGFQASLEVALRLGMEAYVEYTQKAEVELINIPIPDASIEIFDIVEIGPYIGLSMEIENTIKATGALLLGGSVEWNDIDLLLDILNPSNSHANGFSPSFTSVANASGELSMESKLGFPVELGIEIKLDSELVSWKADVGIVDEPSIVMEGKFEVSADVLPDGTIETDINGGCYGIAWDIHFENELYLKAEADDIGEVDYNIIEPQESDPIAEGCIGYVDDGTDDAVDDSVTGQGSKSGLGGNGLNSGGNGLGGVAGNAVGTAASTQAAVSPKKLAVASSSSGSSTTLTGSSSTTTSGAASSSSSSLSATSSSASSSTASFSSSTVQPRTSASSSLSSSTSSISSSTASTSKTATSSSSSSLSVSSSTLNKLAATSSSTTSTASSSSSSKAATSSSSSPAQAATTSKSSSTTLQQTTSKASSTTSVPTTSKSSSSTTAQSTTKSITTTAPSTTSKATSTLATSTSKSSTTTSACSTSATQVSSLFPSTTTTTSTSTTKTSSTKTTSTPSPTSTAITCKKAVPSASVASSYFVGKATTVSTVDLCGANCLQNAQCVSFGYSVQNSCQLYNKMVGSTIIQTVQGGTNATFYDKQCYAWSKC